MAFSQLTEQVYFGNWESPLEVPAKCIINVAHNFSSRRGRNAYWARLEQVPWDTLYFRHALRDRDDVTHDYMMSLWSFARQASRLGKLPILCHCQMGGHRGPSSAIAVAWMLNKYQDLEAIHDKAVELCPGLVRGRNYYRSTMAWLREYETCLAIEERDKS